jgi:hypothetical protein
MTELHLPNGRRSEFLEEKKKARIESLKENKIQTLKITTNNFKSQHPQREKKKRRRRRRRRRRRKKERRHHHQVP